MAKVTLRKETGRLVIDFIFRGEPGRTFAAADDLSVAFGREQVAQVESTGDDRDLAALAAHRRSA